ncbi:thap domain-containing protein 9 [Holotrichia oblita]|uniref:Thap domain-containing protein 9 n=1 Tax=Holotrichia oblita TaxID=644536 RepID=A0ACB9TSM1_HOLOL|nr:thap domain-containing protein 9 [Holotrichia oblita]
MAIYYTHNEEMTGYWLLSSVYRYCQGNSLQSCQVYSERFPNRRTPKLKTFAAVERRLRETRRFPPVSINYGRARTPEIEEDILDRIEQNPKLSSKRLGLEQLFSNKKVAHDTSVSPSIKEEHRSNRDKLPTFNSNINQIANILTKGRPAEQLNYFN